MYYSDLLFQKESDCFTHNLKADFACIALWKPARAYRDKIRRLLSSKFEILLETEIEWSKENFHSNAARLYEEPVFYNKSNKNFKSDHAKKIGDTKFVLFVIKDDTPDYTYAMSVSKKIELSNLNVVKAKYEIRDWIYKDLKIKYAVHSTNNIQEFFFQVPLLLGIDLFNSFLRGEKQHIEKISKDLEGANGWKNWKEVFDILNVTTNYLVLRGFESLPMSNPEKDIDVLTDDFQLFASVLGAEQLVKQPYKGFIEVGGEPNNVDIRFVGDKYYDVVWAKEMLLTKTIKNDLFIPRADHYFFSLLFHAKVQKPEVKEKYIEILRNLAKDLNFTWYQTEMLSNNKTVGQLINGYFRTYHYYYENPLDKGVYKNMNVIKQLQSPHDFYLRRAWQQKVKSKIKKIIPDSIITMIKGRVNNNKN